MHPRYALTALSLALSSLRGAAGAPTDSPSKHLVVRDDDKDVDWDWPKCNKANEGTCTLYMATSLPLNPHNYRNFAIFDHECEMQSLYMTDKQDRDVTLRAHLDRNITIEVDEGTRPKGTITYAGHDSNLGDDLDCYDWEGQVNGFGCRRHFPCKPVRGIMRPLAGAGG